MLLYNLCLVNCGGCGSKFLKASLTIEEDRAFISCVARSGMLAYNSFRWRAIRLFNLMPKLIRCTLSGSVYSFKHWLHTYLTNIIDHPCIPDSTIAWMVVNISNGGQLVMTRLHAAKPTCYMLKWVYSLL